MTPREAVAAQLQAVAKELKEMPYEQLRRLPDQLPAYSDGDEWHKYKELFIDGEQVDLDVLISEWGAVRRRISVELIANSTSGSISPDSGECIYFEKFPSGKIAESWFTWLIVLVCAIAVLSAIVAMFLP